MKKAIGICAIGSALLLATAFAQEHADFKQLMVDTGSSAASLRKSIAAKQADETAASADKVAGIFEQVRAHFEEHHMDDGVTLAKTGQDAAKDMSSAAKAGDWDKASADLKTLNGTCQGCHSAHRERQADGTFKMK
jgi:hypothetical protein